MTGSMTPLAAVAEHGGNLSGAAGGHAEPRRSRPEIRSVKEQSSFRINSLGELGVPLAVLAIVLAMIAPLAPFLLDVLISANITLSIIVLLVALYITKPSEFNVFPTTLLLLSLIHI